jgi:hypothetical protein
MSELRDRAIITLEVPARYGQTIADFLSMLSIDSTVSLEFGKSQDSPEETVCRQNTLNPNRFTMITAPVTGIETPIITKENLADFSTEGEWSKGFATRLFYKIMRSNFHPEADMPVGPEDTRTLLRSRGRHYIGNFIYNEYGMAEGRYGALVEGKYRKGLLAEKLPELVELLKAGYQLPGVGDLGVHFLEEYNSDLYRAVEAKPQAQ